MESFYKMNLSLDNEQRSLSEDLLSQIAIMPFHLVITLTPDDLFTQILYNCGVNPSDDYFSNDRLSERLAKPTVENPLVYNLLGSFKDPRSLVLTHEDVFNYFNLFFSHSAKSMSQLLYLKDYVSQATSCIFLGISFEKWYVQLLLRLFSFTFPQWEKINPMIQKNGQMDHILELYQKDFAFKFIADNTEQFVHDLLEACLKSQIPLKPLPKQTKSLSSKDSINNLILNGSIEQALLQIESSLKIMTVFDKEMFTRVNLTRSRLNYVNRFFDEKKMTFDDYLVERNLIAAASRNLLDEIFSN